ncbi:Programmed cell death protein 2-like [Apodemus speciosus]|uniref:Programmed cell death protein 2-like n=1 Tax=Apodemus speciosus TaxID=105296 RepID=A0ABQ0EY10_APOSI
MYCPLEGSPFHRLLYVFACARQGCGGSQTRSWKVFRSQCLQVPEKETRNAQNHSDGLEAENWCEGSHDWGSDTEETPPPPPASDLGSDSNDVGALDWTEKLQALHLQDTGLAVTCPPPSGEGLAVPTDDDVPQFQPYYICVAEEEDYGHLVDLDHAHSLLQEYQQREGVGLDQLLSLGSSDGDEKYEKTRVNSGDPTFYKFMKRIAACQEQILRQYSWSGEPLFLSCPTFEVSEVPACSGCGGQRTFEFQLMPALVSMLSSAGLGLTVEFGTILHLDGRMGTLLVIMLQHVDPVRGERALRDCLSLLDQLVQLEQVTEHMQSCVRPLEIGYPDGQGDPSLLKRKKKKALAPFQSDMDQIEQR